MQKETFDGDTFAAPKSHHHYHNHSLSCDIKITNLHMLKVCNIG